MEYQLSSGNVVESIRTTDRFLELWDFFQTGLAEMNSRSAADIDMDSFLKRMLTIMVDWPNGALVVLKSKNDKLLGFSAGFNATPAYSTKKVFFVYCLYSNGLYLRTGKDLLEWAKNFARQNDYKSIQMETGKVHGGACQYFQKKLGFTDKKLLFSQEV